MGESTTDGQWPPILQKILDKKSKNKKFNVIDEGIRGTFTQYIAKNTKRYLMNYEPDIVITMIGINDIEQNRCMKYSESNLKIVYLFDLIYKHLQMRYFYSDTSIIYLMIYKIAKK